MTTFELTPDDDARFCAQEDCEREATLITYPERRFHCDEYTHGPQVDRFADGTPARIDTPDTRSNA